MGRVLILAAVFATLAACATETRVVNSSFDSTFGALNKDGWQVSGAGNKRPRSQDASDARVIRGADWSGYHFETNFQVDDGKRKATPPPDEAPPAAAAPASQPSGMTPFGPAPALPGR